VHISSEGRTNTDADPVQVYEIDTFTFSQSGAGETGESRLMSIAVTMLLTEEGPVLGASPSLAPYDTSVAKYDALDYQTDPGFNAGAPAQPVQDKVSQWAAAYASNDGTALATLAGDPSTEVVYTGLGGFTASNISYTGFIPVATVAAVNGITFTDPQYVRVKLLLTAASPQGYAVQAEFDLLVTEAASGQPHVVAWGPAGSAPLTPFENSTTA
jgi:hypothetical protein